MHIDPDIDRAFAALPNRVNELGFDAWGLCPAEARGYFSLARRIFDYFHPEIRGIENLPEGRLLIVPNHAGQMPIDGIIIAVACLLHAKPPRLVRAMVERRFSTFPYVNEVIARAGAVLGDPTNCRNLLLDDQAILVFPEGTRGSGKTFWERYRLQSFGKGFMRLALQTGAPIVPVSVIGGEESIISVYNWKGLARLLDLPYFPIPPLLPLLGLLSYFPLPVTFHVTFGEPMRFTGAFDDDAVIDQRVSEVEARVQQMVNDGLAARKSIF